MPRQPKYQVVPKPERSELEQFASSFHQDFGLMKMTVHEWARKYFGTLTANRSKVLREQLQSFVAQHPGSPDSLRKAWLAQGAQYWPRSIDLEEGLRKFSEGETNHGA
jgi:hypothetical protein